jgi:AraC-like DNA-binding protein
MSWKYDGQPITARCNTGDIVKIGRPTEHRHLLWTTGYHALEITFDASPDISFANLEFDRIGQHFNVNDAFLSRVVTDLYEGLQATPLEKTYAHSMAVVCATHLATSYSNNDKKVFALKGRLSSHQLMAVIDFVRASINRSISLDEMASCSHLSIFHFSRLFKHTVGISPYKFVLQMKIDFAADLIRKKQPVGDIAYSLGFTDSAHFCNAFKRYTGHSPLQSSMTQPVRISA